MTLVLEEKESVDFASYFLDKLDKFRSAEPRDEEEVRSYMITRRWKRDGSKNWMGMEAAVGNLKQNSPHEVSIRSRLLKGEIIETNLAEFYIAD